MAEPALDPDLPICDPHHHLYMTDSPLHARYEIEDLLKDIATHNVRSTVHVETARIRREHGPVCMQPVRETEWIVETSPDGPVRGIVAFADLLLGADVIPVLDAHAEAAGERFKGIRYRRGATGQPQPSYDFLAEPAVLAGAHALAARELLLEIYVSFDLIPSLTAFARSVADLPIVLDHLGVPLIVDEWAGRRPEVLDCWRQSLLELARCENVTVKLGGIGMRTVTDVSQFASPPGSAEIAAYWSPEITFVIEQFGTRRCMFESNFPVDDHLCDYSTLWNVFKRVASDATATERADLFHDTAARVFQLTTEHTHAGARG
jgi:predicted TIM-barrel fold metal-dependent hydrolase